MKLEPFPELEWVFFRLWLVAWVCLVVMTCVTGNIWYAASLVPLAFVTVVTCGVVHEYRRDADE